MGQRGANFTIQNCDFLLTLGARLDFGQTGYNQAALARGAKKVIVDVDAAEIEKLAFTVDVPVVADAKDFLTELNAGLTGFELRDLVGMVGPLRRIGESGTPYFNLNTGTSRITSTNTV